MSNTSNINTFLWPKHHFYVITYYQNKVPFLYQYFYASILLNAEEKANKLDTTSFKTSAQGYKLSMHNMRGSDLKAAKTREEKED